MTSYVPVDLRRLVESRANRLCESDTFLGCQVDHVIAEKHRGSTIAGNLCYACTFCNRAKGTDIGSIAPSTGVFTRFFNPRTDHWYEHFILDGVVIEPRTSIGETTAIILDFNHSERLMERRTLQAIGRYPPDEATGRVMAGDV